MELEPFPPLPSTPAPRIVLRGDAHHWIAWVPTVPGCVAQGATRMEALVQVRRLLPRCLRAQAARVHEAPFDGA